MCSENGLATWIHRISLAHFHFVLLVLQAVNGQHGVHCGWCCSPCDKRVLGTNLQASWGFSLWSLHCFHCACFSVFLVLGFFQETKVLDYLVILKCLHPNGDIVLDKQLKKWMDVLQTVVSVKSRTYVLSLLPSELLS